MLEIDQIMVAEGSTSSHENEVSFESLSDIGGGFNPDSYPTSDTDTVDADLFITKESGGWVRKAASKIWNYIKGKADSVYGKKTEAIKNITRSGTTFTATRCDDTTFTFTQQDNNTTYSLSADGANVKLTPSSGSASTANLNNLINGLTTGDSTPQDADYVITQYVGGGTTTTTYHRRPISKIWDYIKGKIGISSGSTFLRKDGTWATPTNTIPSAICDTDAATAAKVASCTSYKLQEKTYIQVILNHGNTVQDAITLNINGTGAKPIYINGSASSSSNYTLPHGSYFVYYNGTNFYFRTDGKLTANITGSAATATDSTKLPLAGGTVTGTLILSKTQDASGTANNKPALIVGGTDTQAHLELDANEVMAKSNGTTATDLYLNNDGGLVYANGKKVARLTADPVSGRLLIADGTNGQIKDSGRTINSYPLKWWTTWTYNIQITTSTQSGILVWIFTLGGYLTLTTFSNNGGWYVSHKQLNNVSKWTYANDSSNPYKITLNCAEHVPVFIFASNNDLSVTFTDTSTPQANSMSNSSMPMNISGSSASCTGNAATATSATTADTATKLGSSTVGSTRKPIYLNAGAPTALDPMVKHLGNAGKSNMNDIGRLYPSIGMTNLSDPSNETDNPMDGSTKSTSWHLYFDASYSDDPNGSNAWVAQIANRAGTDRWYVRSRRGGTITNGTAWDSTWRHLVTSYKDARGSATNPVYVNENGEVIACDYSLSKDVPSNAVFTDAKVKQTIKSDNTEYRILFGKATNDEVTESVFKSSNIKANPSTGNLICSLLNGKNLGAPTLSGITAKLKVTSTGTTGSATNVYAYRLGTSNICIFMAIVQVSSKFTRGGVLGDGTGVFNANVTFTGISGIISQGQAIVAGDAYAHMAYYAGPSDFWIMTANPGTSAVTVQVTIFGLATIS